MEVDRRNVSCVTEKKRKKVTLVYSKLRWKKKIFGENNRMKVSSKQELRWNA